MVRVRPNEARIVDKILGKGEFPINILDPLHPKLERQALNVHVAFHRIVLGLELLEQWENYINNKFPNCPFDPNASLRGGAASAQNWRDGRNPIGTDQAHYIQAAVYGVPFGKLPDELQRLFGHTCYAPREHNRGIHRSIDNAQEDLINEYLKFKQNQKQNPNQLFATWFNAELAIAYCNNVLSRIDGDGEMKKFQYAKCQSQDIADYHFTIWMMRNSLKRRMEQDNKNNLQTGREFVLDQRNFKQPPPQPDWDDY